MINDQNETASSLSDGLRDRTLCASACPIVMDDDVKTFIRKCGLEQECDFVLKRLMNQFTPEKVTVLLLCSHDNESANEHLTFMLQCDMDRRAFRSGCERFYEPLRNDRMEIYTRMSVHRDI